MRTDLIAYLLHGQNGFDGALTRYKVFRLQFLSSAGGKTHFEVRQPLIPRPGPAHLLGAVFSGQFCDGVKIPGCRFGAEKVGPGVKGLPLFKTGFDPNFVEALLFPVGEKADAVGAGDDSVKVFFDLIQRQIFVYVLAHLEGWLNIERDLGDYTECAKTNDG